jgi:hypothetical protein
MNLPRRRFLHLTAGAAALPAVSRMARAQTYPTRPVRVIVGFAAGGRSVSWVKFRPALPLRGRAPAFTASAPALA